MTKITKREMYAMIADLLADNEEVVNFCEKEIASLDKRNEAAKVRAAKKRAEGDALRDAVYEVLSTDEYMSIADVTAALDDEAITKAKVQYRLNSLVADELAEKMDAKVEGEDGKSRTIKVFKKIAD